MPENKQLHVLVTGANGLVGQALCNFLIQQGHTVTSVGRKKPNAPIRHINWDFQDLSGVSFAEPSSFDAVINLVGANIAEGRWTEHRKQILVSSRLKTTQNICAALIRDNNIPKVFVSASGIGAYGDGKDRVLTEDDTYGRGFLADLTKDWESASSALLEKNVRCVYSRFGIVLSAKGGALKKMLLPFKILGGIRFGDGKQWMSWISIYDLTAALLYVIQAPHITGPCNFCSPVPVQNKTFTDTLAKVLHRPSFFAIPAFFIKIIFGQMGEETLLAGQRALPKKLLDHGFNFQFPQLENALAKALKD